MLYTGTYELTIDSKNRLCIPANIRASMDPERDGTGFLPGSGESARHAQPVRGQVLRAVLRAVPRLVVALGPGERGLRGPVLCDVRAAGCGQAGAGGAGSAAARVCRDLRSGDRLTGAAITWSCGIERITRTFAGSAESTAVPGSCLRQGQQNARSHGEKP